MQPDPRARQARADEGPGAARPRRRRARQHLSRAGRDDTLVDALARRTATTSGSRTGARASTSPRNKWTLDQAAVLRPSRGGANGRRADRRRDDQGRHPLPGLDELHDVRRRRARARGDDDRRQRGLPAPRRPALVAGSSSRFVVPPCGSRHSATSNPQWGDTARRDRCRSCSTACPGHRTASATTRSASWSASPTAPASRRSGATRTSTTQTHEWLQARVRRRAADVLQARSRACVAARATWSRSTTAPELPARLRRAAAADRRALRLLRRRATTTASCRRARRRTYECFERHQPGVHALHVVPRLRAPRRVHGQERGAADVFPLMLGADELETKGGSVSIPKRLMRQPGRHALVDGIPFRLPVNSEQTPALMAAFPIDADRGRGADPRQRAAPAAALGQPWRARDHRHQLRSHRHRPATSSTRSRSPAPTASARRRRCCRRCCQRPLRHRPVRVRSAGEQRDLGQGRQGHLGDAEAPGEPRLRHHRRRPSAASTTSTASWRCGSTIDRPQRRRLCRSTHRRGELLPVPRHADEVLHLLPRQGRLQLPLQPRSAADLIIGDHPRVAPLKQLEIGEPDPLFTAWLPQIGRRARRPLRVAGSCTPSSRPPTARGPRERRRPRPEPRTGSTRPTIPRWSTSGRSEWRAGTMSETANVIVAA